MLWHERAPTSPGLGDDKQRVSTVYTSMMITVESSKPTRLDSAAATYLLSAMNTNDMASRVWGGDDVQCSLCTHSHAPAAHCAGVSEWGCE